MSRWRELAIAVALPVLCIVLYWPVLGHEFVSYDDLVYIVENPNLRAGLRWEAVAHAFSSVYETNWIPLTWISLQIDYALFGLDPAGYHAVNVALHALTTTLLFLAWLRMTGRAWPSAFVAAVFAVHPLHVESVAWASERKDTLSGLWFAAALLAYAGWAKRPTALRQASVAACFALGLLAKPIVVSLPLVLLLLDYWPLGRLRDDGRPGWPERRALRAAVLEKIPLFALAVGASAVTWFAQAQSTALSHGGHLPFGMRIANALESCAWYLKASLWPSGLAVFYPHPLGVGSVPVLIGSAALVAGASALALWGARRLPHAFVGWFWFAITLGPVAGIVQAGLQARADRYMYWPLVGLALIVAWEGDRATRGRRARQIGVAAVAALAIAALAVAARFQLAHWRDTTALYERALDVTRDNFLAHHGLAAELAATGSLEAAEYHAREAVRIKPRWPDAHVVLGDVAARRGDASAAIGHYERALSLDPDHARAHSNLAVVLLDTGRADEAVVHLRQALRAQRDVGFAHLHALLGQALGDAGDARAAIDEYAVALALRPDFTAARLNRGLLLVANDRLAEGVAELGRAAADGAASPELSLALGDASARLHRDREAAAHYRDALRRRPGWVAAANNLAWLIASDPDSSPALADEAVALAEGAVGSDGPSPLLLDTYAAALARAGRFETATQIAEEAAALAESDGLRAEIEARAREYRAGRPYGERRAPR